MLALRYGTTGLADPSGVPPPPGPPRRGRDSRWKTTLDRDIRPAIHRARGTLRAAAASFSDGSALAPLREDLVGTFTRQPHNISFDIAPDDSSVTPTREPTKIEVPLRRWLTETLQPTLDDLLRDLRASGSANAATTRPRGLVGKGHWQKLRANYEQLRRDGRLPATVEVVYGHAWKAAPKVAEDGRAIVRFERKPG